VTLVDQDKSRKASLKETIQTDGLVAIGPLEYCGNGNPIKHGVNVWWADPPYDHTYLFFSTFPSVSLVKDGDPRLLSSETSPTFLVERSARRQAATKVARAADQARVKKSAQALKIARALAKGNVSKAQPISITKQRVKARGLLKKEIDAKVAVVVQLKARSLAKKNSRTAKAKPAKPTPNPTPLAAPKPPPPANPTPTPSERRETESWQFKIKDGRAN
jgi:hypothetical protein